MEQITAKKNELELYWLERTKIKTQMHMKES